MMNLDRFTSDLADLESRGRRRRLIPRRIDGRFLVDDDGRRLLNFGSNDYLGFALASATPSPSTHAANNIAGSTASALVCGWTLQHHRLAESIAALESTESAVLFPSGFAACSGTIATLAAPGDLILSDALNHASLIDGCRLSKADVVVYPHGDVAFVQQQLQQTARAGQRVWIVTDSIFSMDGDIAPLADLVEVAQRYDADLIVDEAHGTGIFGQAGSGVVEMLGLKNEIAVRIGTLSKSIGAQGGFVAGPQAVIDYLINHCRPLIFSTSLSSGAVAAAQRSIDQIQSDPQPRVHVRRLSRRLREAIGQQCVPGDPAAEVPIIAHIVGNDSAATQASFELQQAGFYVPAIRPPTVPTGTARLRISLSAIHTDEDVDHLASALARLTKA